MPWVPWKPLDSFKQRSDTIDLFLEKISPLQGVWTAGQEWKYGARVGGQGKNNGDLDQDGGSAARLSMDGCILETMDMGSDNEGAAGLSGWASGAAWHVLSA